MPTTDPHLLDPDHLPTPYSADEIREGTAEGRTLVVLTEPAGAPGSTRTVRYTECGSDGAVQNRTPVDERGRAVGEPHVSPVSWLELQQHASFPADRTVAERVRLEHPLGDLDCVRYTVGQGDAVDTFWFDVARPGMPVLVDSRKGGQSVLRMTVVADEVRGG